MLVSPRHAISAFMPGKVCLQSPRHGTRNRGDHLISYENSGTTSQLVKRRISDGVFHTKNHKRFFDDFVFTIRD